MISRTRSIGCPFQAVTISPTRTPARAAGPFESMLTTRTPRRLREAWDPPRRVFLLHGLKAGAEITAKDMSSRQELIDSAVDG
jgi:hypothetical protein